MAKIPNLASKTRFAPRPTPHLGKAPFARLSIGNIERMRVAEAGSGGYLAIATSRGLPEPSTRSWIFRKEAGAERGLRLRPSHAPFSARDCGRRAAKREQGAVGSTCISATIAAALGFDAGKQGAISSRKHQRSDSQHALSSILYRRVARMCRHIRGALQLAERVSLLSPFPL